MKNIPPPTGLGRTPPKETEQTSDSKFRFHKPLNKPKRLAMPASTKENLLHVYCMTVLGIIFFIGGGLYLAFRRPGTEFDSSTLIIGGLTGIAFLYHLCKRED